jgi:hypothetical protein
MHWHLFIATGAIYRWLLNQGIVDQYTLMSNKVVCHELGHHLVGLDHTPTSGGYIMATGWGPGYSFHFDPEQTKLLRAGGDQANPWFELVRHTDCPDCPD